MVKLKLSIKLKIRHTKEWDAPDLPEWVRSRVEKSGLSVSAFCQAAGFTRQYYYQLVNGKAENILLETLRRIEAVLKDKYLEEGDRHAE